MGRRSINTTKSGKYMNPTDQASKFMNWCIGYVYLDCGFRKRGKEKRAKKE